MKNNIEYYQHYAGADQHPKFKMLRSKFGWAGEGRFWALNNRIAQADGCCLDISKKYNKASIVVDLDFSIEEFDGFLQHLLKECELVQEIKPGVITTDIIQENYLKVSADREKARKRFARSSAKHTVSTPEESNSSPEVLYKVKESKVKEKKVYPDEIINFTDEFIKFISESKNGLAPKGKNLRSESLATVDKLIRVDGFKLEEITTSIWWAVQDNFWGRNVLSLAALRKKRDGLSKFQKIRASYEQNNNSPLPKKEPENLFEAEWY